MDKERVEISITEFINCLQRDKDYALNKCMNNEYWVRFVLKLRSDKRIRIYTVEGYSDFFHFIRNNGFDVIPILSFSDSTTVTYDVEKK